MSEGAPRSKENLRRFMCSSDVANTATVVPVGQVGGVDAVDPSRMSFSVDKNDYFKDMFWTSMGRFDKIDSERRLLQLILDVGSSSNVDSFGFHSVGKITVGPYSLVTTAAVWEIWRNIENIF